jgi:hypothetical protein
MSTKKLFLVFCLPLLITLVVFYFPYLVGAKTFYFRDLTLYFEPLCRYISESLKNGHFPLWNNLNYCGMPQIGIPSPGIFYPFNWLFVVFSFNQALSINMILSQMAAGMGGFILILSFGWGLAPACLCGFTLALSGYMFSLISNYTIAAGAGWFLLALASLRMICLSQKDHRIYWLYAAIITIFLLIAAGRPEIFAPALLILFCYALTNREYLYLRIRAVILGLLLSAPIVLPAFEWLSLSRRQLGLVNEEVFLFSANWYDILCFILPQPLGDLYLRGNQFLPLVSSDKGLVPFIASAFVGPIIFTQALIGIADSSWRYRIWWLIAIVFALLLILGNNTSVMPYLFNACPLLTLFRFPVKYAFFVVFCLSVLAARGLYVVFDNKKSEKFFAPLLLPVMFWLAVLAFLFIAHGFAFVSNSELLLKAKEAIITSGFISALIGLVVCTMLHLTRQKIISVKIASFLIVILSIFSFNYVAYAYCNHGARADFYKETQYVKNTINNLEKQNNIDNKQFRVTGLYLEFLSYPFSNADSDKNKLTSNWYQYMRQILVPNTNIDAGLPSAFGYESAMTGQYYNAFLNAYLKSHLAVPLDEVTPEDKDDLPLHHLCQVTATKYVITQIWRFDRRSLNKSNIFVMPVPVLDSRYFMMLQEDKKTNIRIYRTVNDLPRAYFTLGAHGSKFVTGDIYDNHVKISFLEDLPENIVLNIEADKEGYLILSDTFYPGWQAKVDNIACKIYPAHEFFRAVQVKPGKHIVTFQYKPQSLYSGIAIAILALIWMAYIFKIRKTIQ